ncbi:hypothetical protein D030_1037B, partial [Vibrio parahaemolyticus AQ3810]
SQCCRTELRER